MADPVKLESAIGHTTRDRIAVRGHDVVEELMGGRDFVEVAYLQMTGAFPTPEQKILLNAMMVAIADHGLTPSALAARLTHYGAPEAMQNAVAAGLLGAGSVVLGAMQNAADLLQREVSARGLTAGQDLRPAAVEIVERERAAGRRLPGVGHPIHVEGDPRVPKLLALSREQGLYGVHLALLEALAAAASRPGGRPLPLNTAGVIGGIVSDFGQPPTLARGLALVARAAGLVAHVLEEHAQPQARKLWQIAEPALVPATSAKKR